MVGPDFDDERAVQEAEWHLTSFVRDGGTPLLALSAGGARVAARQ
jgi:hypothetical protein